MRVSLRSFLLSFFFPSDLFAFSLRKEEIQSMAGQGPNLFALFYDRLRDIKDYHRRHSLAAGTAKQTGEDLLFIPVDDGLFSFFSFFFFLFRRTTKLTNFILSLKSPDTLFTGEEGFGKFLDLHGHYVKFINLPSVKGKAARTYVSYLLNFLQVQRRSETIH